MTPENRGQLIQGFLEETNTVGLNVFGYGSIMWNPGFEYASAAPARIYGHSRQLCIYSVRYRGTPRHPGLVFGLDAGGSCTGMLFSVRPRMRRQVLRYLFDREIFADVYHPQFVCAHYVDGRAPVKALTFIATRGLPSYAGNLPEGKVRELVCHAKGERGTCREYIENTCQQLRQLRISHKHLSRLLNR